MTSKCEVSFLLILFSLSLLLNLKKDFQDNNLQLCNLCCYLIWLKLKLSNQEIAVLVNFNVLLLATTLLISRRRGTLVSQHLATTRWCINDGVCYSEIFWNYKYECWRSVLNSFIFVNFWAIITDLLSSFKGISNCHKHVRQMDRVRRTLKTMVSLPTPHKTTNPPHPVYILQLRPQVSYTPLTNRTHILMQK